LEGLTNNRTNNISEAQFSKLSRRLHLDSSSLVYTLKVLKREADSKKQQFEAQYFENKIIFPGKNKDYSDVYQIFREKIIKFKDLLSDSFIKDQEMRFLICEDYLNEKNVEMTDSDFHEFENENENQEDEVILLNEGKLNENFKVDNYQNNFETPQRKNPNLEENSIFQSKIKKINKNYTHRVFFFRSQDFDSK